MKQKLIDWIWRKKIESRYRKIDNFYSNMLSSFHPLEADSIRTIKNSFNFFFNRRRWEHNKERIERELYLFEKKV